MEMALLGNGGGAPDPPVLPKPKGPIFPGRDNSGLRRTRFPKDFVFGTGTSAYQNEGAAAEGGKSISIWDDFILSNPGNIVDGKNGNVTCDMYHRYKDDIRLMKQMGLDSYRFSISWPRILPGGRWSAGLNRAGIEYYNDLINTVIANGMKPFVTLFHWDLPDCLEKEYGGFLSENIKDDFLEFAKICFWEFGDRVKLWNTLNEPWTYAIMGYVLGSSPPGRKIPGATLSQDEAKIATYKSAVGSHIATAASDNKSATKQQLANSSDAYVVGRNMLLAHVEAVKCYKNKFQEFQQGKIGITLNSTWIEPYEPTSPLDRAAARRGLDFMLGWFLEPILLGDYPQTMRNCVSPDNLASFTIEERKDFAEYPIDFLGLSYYTAQFAKNDPSSYNPDGGYYADHMATYTSKGPDGKDIGKETGADLFYVVPWGLYYLLAYINDKYPSLKEIFIAENGVADKSNVKLTAKQVCSNDDVRTTYLQDHLANIIRVMEDYEELMDKVKGYFVWAWCDNIEWVSGYTLRMGLIYIDFVNDLTRYPKDSALWFAKFLTKSLTNERASTVRENDDDIESPQKRLKS